MRRKAAKHDFKSEEKLCSFFIGRARAAGWLAFPETSGHDILLVATKFVKTTHAHPGDQIGIQAKLRPNVEVIFQAMPQPWDDTGPHFHAVLIPRSNRAFDAVARRCGVVVFQATGRSRRWNGTNSLERKVDLSWLPAGKRLFYASPCWHPEIEIHVPAGIKSPRLVTPWKIDAIRFCLRILSRGYVTSADFAEANISMGRWIQYGWITPTAQRDGRRKKYVLDLTKNPPHLAWPDITEQLCAEDKK